MNGEAPPTTKPKRPLSAYNLFYRFKRAKIMALEHKADEDAIVKLVETPPGLEDCPSDISCGSLHLVSGLRRTNIEREMKGNLLPRDTRARSHRTNRKAINGAISFVDLGKLMNTSWQRCDEFAKDVFRELAEKRRVHYRKRIEEYKLSGAASKDAAIGCNKFNLHHKSNAAMAGKVATDDAERLAKKVHCPGEPSAVASLPTRDGIALHVGSVANQFVKTKRGFDQICEAYSAFNSNNRGSYTFGAPQPHQLLKPNPTNFGEALSQEDNVLALLAQSTLRAVPRDDRASMTSLLARNKATVEPANTDQAKALLARMATLEGQLAKSRLHSRANELRREMARQDDEEVRLKIRLAQLRALDRSFSGKLVALSRNQQQSRGALLPSASSSAGRSSRPAETHRDEDIGLLSLASAATMVRPPTNRVSPVPSRVELAALVAMATASETASSKKQRRF